MAPNPYRQPVIDGSLPLNSSHPAHVDLSDKEQNEYSITRAIRAQILGNWSDAGLEREVSLTLAKQLGRDPSPGGLLVPANLRMNTRAAYNVVTASQGGNLVATNLLAESFIEALVNRLAIAQAGVKMLPGLVGNIDLPRKTAKTQANWIAEGATLTESEMTFDKVSLTPKVVGCYSRYSRLALQQTTPDIETIVRQDLAEVMARAIDLAGISGSGTSSQPKGILNQTGINTIAAGTNGGAVTIDTLLDLRGAVSAANVDATRGAFIINEKTATALRKLKTTYGEYLFAPEGPEPGPAGISVLKVAGNPVIVSNQLTSAGTKGTGTGLSTALFGVFDQCILANWGVLEILLNPFGAGYTSGDVEIRALQTVDFAVRHAEAFAKVSDLITA